MNQRLSDWANIAQIASGLAVVVTLVLLIVSLRENTDVTRAAMYQQSTDSLIDFRRDVMNDPKLAELYNAFLNDQVESVEGVDRVRLTQLVLNIFQISENAFFTRRYGLLGNAEWSRFEQSICDYYALSRSAGLAGSVQRVMTRDFMGYITQSCGVE